MNPEENKKTERVPIKSLRTFQGDVQEAISKNNYSTTTILVKEQARKLENPVETAEVIGKSNARNKTFIIFGVFFIVIGIVSVAALYYIKANEEIIVEKQTKAIIAFTEESQVPMTSLNRKEIFEKINENKSKNELVVNSVIYINPLLNDNQVPTENLLSVIAPSMLPSLNRSFDKEYMLGVYSYDTNEPFIILTVKDYSLSYPGMLKWEESMALDLGEIFNYSPNQSSSTPRVFVDEVIKNRDIRALKDSSGNYILLYSFVDRKTLVITKNENMLSAIVGKLIISKQIK